MIVAWTAARAVVTLLASTEAPPPPWMIIWVTSMMTSMHQMTQLRTGLGAAATQV